MTAIVSGIFSRGKLELLQTPVGIRDGKVRVIVMEESQDADEAGHIHFGKYGSGTLSTEDDFASAEWGGLTKWDNHDGQ